MISVEQGRRILQSHIASKSRHQYYKRTVELRKFYHAIVTGEGLGSYLNRFETRESEEEFKVRVKVIRECITPGVNEACAKFYKTSRYPNIKKEMKYEKGSNRIEQLQEALEKFCYDGDVGSYLALDFDLKSLIDPNSFLVIDFESYDALQNQRPETYGVYIPCDEVVDFEYMPNDVLNYLMISKEVRIFTKDDNYVDLTDYIGYLGDQIIMYNQAHEDRENMHGDLMEIGSTQYYFHILDTLADQVQAHRLGYRKDAITGYKTVVSPLENARTVIMDLNDDKSEYDQTKRFHVFPQKYQFVKHCPGESTIKTCADGKQPDGQVCSVCQGKGVLIHMSSKDVITLPMPRDKDEYIMPLSEMSHYAKPDIEIIKHLREDIQAGKRAIKQAIFTTESAPEVDGGVNIDKTATETTLRNDDINDIILPYARHKSKIFKFIVRQVAIFSDLDEGLKVLYEYPTSLRLETIEELQTKFSELVKAGASPTLLDDIETEIAAKRFIDDPEGLKRYEFWKIHRPFRNRTSDDVQFAIGGGYVPKYKEVLWAMYEDIITELENEYPKLHTMDFKAAHDLIVERAKEYVTELEPVVPKTGFLDSKNPAQAQKAEAA